MRLADFVPKRKLPLAAKRATAYLGGEAFVWVGIFLILLGGSYSIFLGLAALILCWGVFPVLIVRRALKLDIKALDDPNDNPRANRLIANRRDHGSSDAQSALLCALLVLMFASVAYLHERWTIVAYIAALIFVIAALLLVRRTLKRRNPV
jgi:hypothetical protein